MADRNLQTSIKFTADGAQAKSEAKATEQALRGIGGGAQGAARQATAALEDIKSPTIRIDANAAQVQSAANTANAAIGTVETSARASAAAVRGLFVGVATVISGVVGAEATATLAEFDRLNASLKTVTGSLATAGAASTMLRQFATQTPYELGQVTEAFIRLRSLGLDASEKSLRSYGNTAAAMGKPIMQFIEAVADASTGEFERLKEFGIKASAQGKEIAFTFQGVTTKVANDAKSITDYLRGMGETKFASGMADQMDTVGGKLSNLKDQFSGFVDFLGDLGGRDVLKGFFSGITGYIAELQKQLSGMFGTGLTAQINAFETQAASASRVLEQLQNLRAHYLNAGQQTLADMFAPQSEIERRRDELIGMNKALVDLRKQQQALDAQSASLLSQPATPSGAGVGGAGTAKDAMSAIRARYEAQRNDLANLVQELKAQEALEVAEAGESAAAKLEIEQKYLESYSSLKREEIRAAIVASKEELALAKDREAAEPILQKLAMLENDLASSQRVQALEAKKLTVEYAAALPAMDAHVRAYEAAQEQVRDYTAAIREQEQLASSRAQNVQAKVTAGVISETEAREELNQIYSQTASNIAPVLHALQELSEGGANAAKAAIEAETAMLHMTSAVRTPLQQLADQWADVNSQMRNTSADAMRGISDVITQMVTTGKADFSGLLQSLQGQSVQTGINGILGNFIKGYTGATAANVPADGIGPVLPAGNASAGVSGGISQVWKGLTGSGPYSAGSYGNAAYNLSGVATAVLDRFIDPNEPSFGKYTTNQDGQTAQKVFTTITDVLSNIPVLWWLKFAKYDLKLQFDLLHQMMPDKKPNLPAGIFLGPMGAMLFGDIVKSNASFNFQNGQMQPVSAYSQNGGALEVMQGMGQATAAALKKVEAAYGIKTPDFYVNYLNRGDKFRVFSADMQGRTLYEGGSYDIKDETMAREQERLLVALLHREKTLSQFDDRMYQSAVRFGNTMTEIESNRAGVTAIRMFEGEVTELANTLRKQQANFEIHRDTVWRFTDSSNRRDEMGQLKTAWQKRFAEQAAAVETALGQLSGIGESAAVQLAAIDKQIQILRSQDRELQMAAKQSGKRLKYDPLTESDFVTTRETAVANLRNQTLATIYQALGQSLPLSEQIAAVHRQFDAIRRDAPALGIALALVTKAEVAALEALKPFAAQRAQITADIQAVRDGIVGPEGVITRLSADIASGFAGLNMLWDPGLVATEVSRISGLVMQRYQIELQQVQAQIAAAQQLKSVVASLKLSNLSPLTPTERYREAESQYQSLLARAQSGDAGALQQLSGAAQAYLGVARDYDPGTYRVTFNQVSAALESLGQKFSEGDTLLESLQQRTIDVLSRLADWLEGRQTATGMPDSVFVGPQAAPAPTPSFTVPELADFATPAMLGIQTRAGGGLTRGWALVGERGPELVDFAMPGRVYTAGQTRDMLAPGHNAQLLAGLAELLRSLNAGNDITETGLDRLEKAVRYATPRRAPEFSK